MPRKKAIDATIILLDVSKSVKPLNFQRSVDCALRTIENIILTGKTNEVSVILFGHDDTKHYLSDQAPYKNIYELFPLGSCSLDMVSQLAEVKQSNVRDSNWLTALGLVSTLFGSTLEDRPELSNLKIMLFSDCSSADVPDAGQAEAILQALADELLNPCGIQLTVIGSAKDFNEIPEQLPNSCMLFKFLNQLNDKKVYHLQDAHERLKYYEYKTAVPRKLSVPLEIGSIRIPVKWMKVSVDVVYSQKTLLKLLNANSASLTRTKVDIMPQEPKSTEAPQENNPDDLEFSTDDNKIAFFGSSKVVLSYADTDTLKKRHTISGFKLLGTQERFTVHPYMLQGEQVYAALPDPSPQSHALFTAFVDALVSTERVGIARRILTNNGSVKLGVLLPVSDEQGKQLYFIRLPTSELSRPLPFLPPLPAAENPDLEQLVDQFIESNPVPDELLEANLLARDPSYQALCHQLTQKAKRSWSSDQCPVDLYLKRSKLPFEQELITAFGFNSVKDRRDPPSGTSKMTRPPPPLATKPENQPDELGESAVKPDKVIDNSEAGKTNSNDNPPEFGNYFSEEVLRASQLTPDF